jgi:hypothetical protein
MLVESPVSLAVTDYASPPAAALGAVFGLSLVAALWQFPSPFDGNGDASWLLYVAGRYLDGAQLYVDVFETNPPMSILLSVPAAWLSRQTGIAAELCLYTQVIVIACVSLWAAARLAEPAGLIRPDQRAIFLALAAFAMLVMPSRCFAQREHFAAIVLLPYLMLQAARWRGPPPAGFGLPLLAGLGAGLAMCIKPYFGLCLAFAHLALLVRSLAAAEAGPRLSTYRSHIMAAARDGRLVPPEAIVALAGLAVYVAAALLFFPDYFGPLLERIALAYLPHRLTPAQFFASHAFLLLLSVSAFAWLARIPFWAPLPLALAAGAAGGLASALIQFKGWAYHQLPTVTLALLAIAAASLLANPSRHERRSSRALALGALALLFGAAAPAVFAAHDKPRALEAAIRSHAPHPSLLIASSNLGLSFPLVSRLDARWTGRSASLWMSEGSSSLLGHERDPERRKRLKVLFDLDRQNFVEDAVRSRPDVIGLAAVDAESDLLPWAMAVPVMAVLLADYQQTALVDGVRVMVRKDLLNRNMAPVAGPTR